ncbi:MAG: hypothetical protein ACYC2T_11115 [Bacillota bacterium]
MKISWKLIGIVVLVALLLIAGYFMFSGATKVDPVALTTESLEKTLSSKSYRYLTELKLIREGGEVTLSKIQGEKAGEEDFHITGVMQQQEVEVYQLQDTTYLKDPVTGKWMEVPGNNLMEQELFMTEINPLGNFKFSSLGEVTYKGVEKLKGKKHYLVELHPEVESDFLQRFWKDFTYQMWVDPQDQVIKKALVRAVHKADPKTAVSISVEFYDYGAKIKLEAPKKN